MALGADLGTAFGRIVITSDTGGIGAAKAGLSGLAKTGLVTGAALGVAFGAAAYGVAQAVSVASDFEAAMSDVAAVSEATGAQLEQLSAQALKAGADTKFSAREAAAGQYELAKAGLSVEQILGGGLQGALALAAAGDIEVADAAAYAANAMKLFALEGDQVTSVADAFAVAANQTTADVGDFGLALTQGGAAAKSAGLDLFQTLGVLEALADAGVKGSDAGTSLKAAFLQLLNPTAKQAALADDLGINFLNANGTMKDAAGISVELRKATAGMTLAQRTATLATLAGTDGVRTLLALYDAGPRRLQAYERGLQRSGAAAQVAADRQDNLRGDVEELSGAWETLQIKVGTALLPTLRAGAQGAREFVNSFSDEEIDSFASSVDSALRTTASSVSATVDAVTPLAMALGDLALAGADAAGTGLQVLGIVAVPVAGALLAVATSAASAAAAVLSFATGIASSPAGMTALVVALAALAGAYAAVRLAALAATVAIRVQAVTGAVAAFLSLASSVRTAAQAMALLQLASATALGPIGLVGLAIGAVVGGVLALSSGMFAGQSVMGAYQASLANVGTAAQTAAGAVNAMRDATNNLVNANLSAERADLAVAQALQRVRDVRAQVAAGALSGNAATLAERDAVLSLKEARERQRQATEGAGRSQEEAKAQALESAGALAALATAQGDATDKARTAANVTRGAVGQLVGNKQAALEAAKGLESLGASTTDTATRLNAVQASARKAAAGIKGTDQASQEAKAALEAVGNATPGQLEQFNADVQAGTKAGLDETEATTQAMARLLENVGQGATADLSSLTASIRSQGNAAIEEARRVRRQINAELKAANADKRESPSANDLLVASLLTMRGNMARGLGSVLKEADRGGSDVLDSIRALGEASDQLAKQEERRQAVRDARQRAGDRGVSVLNGGAAFGKGARGAIGGDLNDAMAEERRAAAAYRKADADAKDQARQTLNSARQARREAEEELREFGRTSRVAIRQGALQAAKAAGEAITSAIGEVESTLSDFASRATAAIDDSLARTTAAIDRGLKAAMAAIDASPAAARIDAIGQEIDASRRAREDRDAGRQRGTLTADATKAQATVDRLRGVLANARTESERQAATTLLNKALEDQQTAAGALADFEEDQRLVALERERQGLQAQLDLQRTAAQQQADAAREAAQAEADARKAVLNRELGDLAESYRNREITLAQFNARLAAIAGDPKLVADLDASGRELGLSFSRGITRSLKAAEGAAKGLADAVAAYLRLHSPADKGPLRHDFATSGALIGSDLAAGLASKRRAVATEAERVANAAALAGASRGADRGAGPAEWAASQAPAEYHVHAERPVEDALLIAQRLEWQRRYGRGG